MAKKIAIIGSGPAGLMAATICVEAGHLVTVYERRSGLGRKLLIAGSSGLNVSHEGDFNWFESILKQRNHGTSGSAGLPILCQSLKEFSSKDWLGWIERLGHEPFLGTSQRWFVKEMKAAPLLNSWVEYLKSKGVHFQTEAEWAGIQNPKTLKFKGLPDVQVDCALLALGGASWENQIPSWVDVMRQLGILVQPFRSSNCGFAVTWPDGLLKEAEGKPIKNCELTTARGSTRGELMITHYGIEGTPVYSVGTPGKAWINFFPDQTPEQIFVRLSRSTRENWSPIRRVKKLGGLSEAALAVIYHLTRKIGFSTVDLKAWAELLCHFPIELGEARPLSEAISSAGGVDWSEVDATLQLKRYSGVYLAGEMLDWDAPTGGYLIQTSVALGVFAARNAIQSKA